MSSHEALKILDLDSGESEDIRKSTGVPIDFDVAIEENIAYWVNSFQEIFSSRINSSGNHKVNCLINNLHIHACMYIYYNVIFLCTSI